MECDKVYAFDDFVFDMNGYKLSRNGRPISLQQRTGELLGLLIENAHLGSIPKEKIFDRLYGKTGAVTDYALYFQIHQLRKALSDNARKPKYIQFARKRGIAFIGDLRAIEERQDEPPVTAAPDNLPKSSVPSRREKLGKHRQVLVPVSLLLVVLMVATVALKGNLGPAAIKVVPRIDTITALSASVAGRQIYVQLTGERFDPRTARILVIGAGCSDIDPCCVPNEPLNWYGRVTELEIERVPLTLAPGDFQILVQNGPDGGTSNAVPLTVTVE